LGLTNHVGRVEATVNSDSQIDRRIKHRIQSAMERGLPRLLINLFHHNNVESWPHWPQSNIPEGVVSAIELERTVARVSTEIVYDDTKLLFTRFKIGEDSVECGDYKYSYWAYEILLNDRVVFGIEAMHHWAGGKPEFKEVTAYVPGAWEETFQKLKSASEELARIQASKATAERRKTNAGRRKEEEKLQLDRFGLNSDAPE
jgi:hypothetical protein